MAAAAALPPLNLYGKMTSFFNPGCFANSPFCFLSDWGRTPATLDVIGLGQWVCVLCSVCGFLCLCEQQKCKHFFRHAYHGLWIWWAGFWFSHIFEDFLCMCVLCSEGARWVVIVGWTSFRSRACCNNRQVSKLQFPTKFLHAILLLQMFAIFLLSVMRKEMKKSFRLSLEILSL